VNEMGIMKFPALIIFYIAIILVINIVQSLDVTVTDFITVTLLNINNLNITMFNLILNTGNKIFTTKLT
jgi:hypothetical protein